MALLDIIPHGARSRSTGPGRASSSTRDGWQAAIDQLAAGELTLLGLWGDAPPCTWRCSTSGRRHRRRQLRLPRRPLSVRRRAASAGDPARTRDPRSVRPRAGRRCPTRGPGSITAAGTCAIRSATQAGRAKARALRVPAGRRREPAPDPGRPGACRHHRARPFPLHRQRRDRGAAGGAARLRAQGHRVADARARRSSTRRRLAGRTSGDSTVAYALRLRARRRGGAAASTPPPRAVWLRALMAELERLANHFGDIGAICNDASFALMHAHCGILRERVLRAADACFGHRLMMDCDRARRRRARSSRRTARRACARCSPKCRSAFPAPGRALRQHRLAAGPHRRHRHRHAGLRAPVRRRRLCRPRLRPRLRRAPRRSAIRPTTRSPSRCRCSSDGDVNARVWIRIREVEQSLSLIEQILDRAAGGRHRAPTSGRRASRRRPGAGRRLPRRRAGLAAARRRRPRRALPSARPVLVPVAAAGGRDRGQHRRRLPALQQIVQLLLFGARSLMRMRTLFESFIARPAHRSRRPAADDAGARRAGAKRRPRRARQARPLPVDPRGRCRLLQRLRTGNPRAQQRLLRSRALRPALRRLAAPCRRAAGDRAGDQEHARGAGAHLRRDARSEMGGRGRRLRASTAASSPAATPSSAASRPWCRSICTSAAARPIREPCSPGCWRCCRRRLKPPLW